jgi:hypothetical protein
VRTRHLIWPVLALSAVLDLLGLSRSGVQAAYYEAAVKSMAHDWTAFFFASLDPATSSPSTSRRSRSIPRRSSCTCST